MSIRQKGIRILKRGWRLIIRIGKKHRVTNNLLEHKVFPAINRYKHRINDNRPMNVTQLVNREFMWSQPFDTKKTANSKTRINILYNDFDAKSFFGGKATALIVANLLAHQFKYDLRIIGTNIHPEVYDIFLNTFGMEKIDSIEFQDFNKNNRLEVGSEDYFIATNAQNAQSVLDNSLLKNRDKLFYMMQEVETMFYDHGDRYLITSQVMKSPSIVPIVNTKLLYDWFCDNEYNNVKNRGVFFEPAFPLAYKNKFPEKKPKKPYKLFFYARPGHQRNLFYFGIKTLNQVFLSGTLDPKDWVIYISDDGTTPLFTLDSEVKVEKIKPMDWLEYNEFLRGVDITYSMIYTPHPSYPPLDTAMIGGVCVTNKYKNKQSLSNYSKNIVTADLTESAMMEAFSVADKIVRDDELRKKNYSHNNINEDWEKSLDHVIKYMRDTVEDV
jgi:hypothetical protein